MVFMSTGKHGSAVFFFASPNIDKLALRANKQGQATADISRRGPIWRALQNLRDHLSGQSQLI